MLIVNCTNSTLHPTGFHWYHGWIDFQRQRCVGPVQLTSVHLEAASTPGFLHRVETLRGTMYDPLFYTFNTHPTELGHPFCNMTCDHIRRQTPFLI